MPFATAAGSASSNTSTGALPPSSRCTRLSVSAAARATSLPVATSPVRDTMRTSRWRTMPAPTGSPSPVITFSTPAGRRPEPLGQRLLCRLDGPIDVGLGAARNLGDRLAGGRVQHLHRAALDGLDPLAADEVLVLRGRYAHQKTSRSFRRRLSPSASRAAPTRG